MIIKMDVELIPFPVPGHVEQKMAPVKREQFDSSSCKYPIKFFLSELEPEVLAGLCDEFRREVFKKARKKDPAINDDPKPTGPPLVNLREGST